MFIAALFTKARNWNQFSSISVEEWIKAMYTYMIEFYSIIKKSHAFYRHIYEMGKIAGTQLKFFKN